MTGSVYAIGEKPGGPVKIGYAASPAQRLAELQTGNHLDLRVLASFPGTLEDEAALHRRFAILRIRGEWFMDAREQITRGFGPTEDDCPVGTEVLGVADAPKAIIRQITSVIGDEVIAERLSESAGRTVQTRTMRFWRTDGRIPPIHRPDILKLCREHGLKCPDAVFWPAAVE